MQLSRARVGPRPHSPHSTTPVLSISGENFLLDGVLSYAGRTSVTMTDAGGTANLEGSLMGIRTINAIFDDDNGATTDNWDFPSGPAEVWDPDRNVAEFVAALPSWAARGISMLVVGLQGGNPAHATATGNGNPPDWIVSAFNSDGTLKQAWLDRAAVVVETIGAQGMVVLLQLFYQRQETRLTNEAAAQNACDEISDWVVSQGYTHVMLGVQNEVGVGEWATGIWQPARAHELIDRIKARHSDLIVGTGMNGGNQPSADVVTASDYLSFSGNVINAAGAETYIDDVRAMAAWIAEPKPIMQIEDAARVADAEMDVVLKKGCGFCYHDDGPAAGTVSNYSDGFQWMPANWTVNTAAKQAFFDKVEGYAGV